MQRRILYDSPTALVVAVGDPTDAGVCVTFRPFFGRDDNPDTAEEGFGEPLLMNFEVPAVHFINRQNHWWLIPDLEACLDAVRPVVARATRRTGYGASLGAYAALRFSRLLDLDEVLAFSPQYSIDPVKVPFETRWPDEAAQLDFRGEDMKIRAGCRVHVVLDPRSVDGQHLALIRAANPGAVIVAHEIPDGGHRVIRSFAAGGYLRKVLRSLRHGPLDVEPLRAHPGYSQP